MYTYIYILYVVDYLVQIEVTLNGSLILSCLEKIYLYKISSVQNYFAWYKYNIFFLKHFTPFQNEHYGSDNNM